MNAKKKSTSKIGKMHKCADVKSYSDSEPSDDPATRAAGKSDIDERERQATPQRKAAGPGKRRQRKVERTAAPPSTPDVAPESITKRTPKRKKS